MPTTATTLTASVDVVARLALDPSGVQHLDDDALLAASRDIAAARQHLDAYAGAVAAEISRRSRRELGYAGLAQREGFRTPEALLQSMTGSTRADAVALVKVGTIVAEATAEDVLAQVQDAGDGVVPPDSDGTTPSRYWLAGIARAVSDGRLSFAQAEGLRAGLGEPSEAVPAEVLADASALLIDAASDQSAPVTADGLRRLARQLRDRFDAEGLAARERLQRDAQYLRAWKRADGMVAGALLLDAENGAYLLSVIDEITSPRRGGPRFVAEADRARATRLSDDPRSTERIAAESVLELLRIGTAADAGVVFGSRTPSVRIVVTEEALAEPVAHEASGSSTHSDGLTFTAGGRHGIIELTGESVSVGVVERQLCESGAVRVTVDPRGRPLDVGREQRLFTKRQRIALAVRDGGCMWPECDRPPSWTEAHHVDHWHDDHGRTDVADGILLCRYHHLLLHNNGWKILRRDDGFRLRPPGASSDGELVLLRSKSPLLRDRRVG